MKEIYNQIKIDIKRLQTTYNNLKQKWGKKVGKKKNDSGLADWFKITNTALSDTNSGLENVFSDPLDTSFYSENFSVNDDEEAPNSKEYSQAAESQINEEYAIEAPNSGFDEGEIEESNLSEKKKQGKNIKIVSKPY